MSSGNWTSANCWSPAGVPACGDSVVVSQTHTITITTQQDYMNCMTPLRINVSGTLRFQGGSKLKLPCGSYVIIYAGGSIHGDQGNQNSNYIEICGQPEWYSFSMYGPACLPPTHPFCSAFLPVGIGMLDAEACGLNRVCLFWETMSERNSDYFEVERSADGGHFEVAGRVHTRAGNGNSDHGLQYSWTDYSPLPGLVFYRLRQVDRDLSFTYSGVTYARTVSDRQVQMMLYPSVNGGEFTLRICGLDGKQDIRISLYDITGSIVYHSSQRIDDRDARINIRPANSLASGLYHCCVQTPDGNHTLKLLVRR